MHIDSLSLETPRLVLHSGTPDLLVALLSGQLSQKLDVRLPETFSIFGDAPIRYALEQLKSEDQLHWWMYLAILKSNRAFAGICGFKGMPDDSGTVEIGYEVLSELQGRGFATEMAEGLVRQAFSDARVKLVRAHTLTDENPSARVLMKLEFRFTGKIQDPDDGVICRWELQRSGLTSRMH